MIQNAKILGANIDYAVYSKQAEGVGRGHPQFNMSRSNLVSVAKNPKRWKDGYKSDEDDTTATIWGSLIDCLVLEPQKFEARYAVSPATYQVLLNKCPGCGSVSEAKKCRKCGCDREATMVEKEWTLQATACKDWAEEQGDKEIIKAEKYEEAKVAMAALKADTDLGALLACSQKQVMVVAEYVLGPITIPLRVLIDLVPDVKDPDYGSTLANFKTARDADPADWDKVVNAMGYDVSAALELDLYNAATGEKRNEVMHPVQENVKPWHFVNPWPSVTPEFLTWGRNKYQAALLRYATCLASEKWPSYPTGNRLVIGARQMIGPDDLWAYRTN